VSGNCLFKYSVIILPVPCSFRAAYMALFYDEFDVSFFHDSLSWLKFLSEVYVIPLPFCYLKRLFRIVSVVCL